MRKSLIYDSTTLLIAGRASEHAGGRDHCKAPGGEVENLRTGTETHYQSAVQLQCYNS
jgi:hypothetical protein